MATFFGKILRGAAASIQSPIKAITGKSIFNESYTGDTSKLPTEKAASWFVDTVLGGGLKPKTADAVAPSVEDQISGAITNLFGGVAEKAGAAAGVAAGQTVSKEAPSWLWPIIIVGSIILVFGLLLVTIVKKRRR